MKNAIIFDFDGVILDSFTVKTDAFAKIFEKFNKKDVQKLLDYHIKNGGISRFVKIRYFFETILNSQISEEDVQIYASQFSDIVTSELLNQKYIIKETLEFIKSEFKSKVLFIASGAEQEELRFICKHFAIDNNFKGIFGSPTPKDEIVKNILNDFKLIAHECVLIGDSINDYDAAKKNSVEFYGYNNTELKPLGGYINSFNGFTID